MAPYIVVPMPHMNDASQWKTIVLPIDFLSLPKDIQWVWDPITNDAYQEGSSEGLLVKLGIVLSTNEVAGMKI